MKTKLPHLSGLRPPVPDRKRPVRYGSLCSGIETAALAFPKAWAPAWFCETDPFCCALLERRYPTVPNYGDITKAISFPAVDLVVAGTPCQSFSIQGLRAGLADARGNLSLRFCQVVRQLRPSWIVWENVPNVLRIDGGNAFGSLLAGLGQCGYGLAYRILDAQYFGVPQRRRRVFVVGHYRDWQSAAAVLFDAPCHQQNADSIAAIQQEREQAGGLSEPLLGWTGDETPKYGVELVPTLRASQGGEGVGIIGRGKCRQLSIAEWERLQGIPDDYTKLEGWSNAKRKHAIGNAFCVPVLRWIAERIERLHSHFAAQR